MDVRRREAGSHVGRKKEDRSMEDSSVGGKSAGKLESAYILYKTKRDIF